MAKPGPKSLWYNRHRYRRARCIERLKPQQVSELFNADAFARKMGRPLNLYITIAFVHTREGEHRCHHRFAHLRDRVGKAMASWNVRHYGLYVFEALGGIHVHWLLHCPSELQPNLVSLICNCIDAVNDHAVDVKRRSSSSWNGLMRYICKGTDWVTAKRIGRAPQKQGDISFKRCGTTANIGRQARERAGLTVPTPTGIAQKLRLTSRTQKNVDGNRRPMAKESEASRIPS